MKAVTGHGSDSVLQGYINHGQLSRTTAANAVSVGQKRTFSETESAAVTTAGASSSRSTVPVQ